MYILAAIAILQGFLTLLDGIRAAWHMRTFRPKRQSGERVLINFWIIDSAWELVSTATPVSIQTIKGEGNRE